MEKFRSVLDLHLKHHSALGYGLVTLLTAGGERVFSAAVFQCPCSATWNLPYGLVFLLVPALALFLLGYVLNARTWRLLTGCCARGARSRSCGAALRDAVVCAQLSAAAAVAPLTWVSVALLGGAFYECAATGTGPLARRLCRGRDPTCEAQLPLAPCGLAQASDAQALLKELKAQSQVRRWPPSGGWERGRGRCRRGALAPDTGPQETYSNSAGGIPRQALYLQPCRILLIPLVRAKLFVQPKEGRIVRIKWVVLALKPPPHTASGHIQLRGF